MHAPAPRCRLQATLGDHAVHSLKPQLLADYVADLLTGARDGCAPPWCCPARFSLPSSGCRRHFTLSVQCFHIAPTLPTSIKETCLSPCSEACSGLACPTRLTGAAHPPLRQRQPAAQRRSGGSGGSSTNQQPRQAAAGLRAVAAAPVGGRCGQLEVGPEWTDSLAGHVVCGIRTARSDPLPSPILCCRHPASHGCAHRRCGGQPDAVCVGSRRPRCCCAPGAAAVTLCCHHPPGRAAAHPRVRQRLPPGLPASAAGRVAGHSSLHRCPGLPAAAQSCCCLPWRGAAAPR